MTIADLLRQAAATLSDSDSARLDVELLLAQVLGKSREFLYTWPEYMPTASDIERFRQLCARRASGYPIAYLLGRREFWTLDLRVTPDVLIPRPDTELLVSVTLALLPGAVATVADLGTGSGAIALSLASERPLWRVLACDSSRAALAVARLNGSDTGINNVTYHEGEWCNALVKNKKLDAIIANPPYIAEDDPHLQLDGLRFEPRQALVASDKGFSDLRCIIDQSPDYLRPGAWLILEHGNDQGAEVRNMLIGRRFVDVETRLDLAGRERVSLGRWSPNQGQAHE
jgi:release factor glutamine methyltransferase